MVRELSETSNAAYTNAEASADAYATTVADAAVGRTSDVTACDAAGYSVATVVAAVAAVVGGGRVAVAHVPTTRGCITSSGIAATLPTGCGWGTFKDKKRRSDHQGGGNCS
jgi:hypothetical protein